MKQLIAIFTSILFIGFTANATTTNYFDTNSTNPSSIRGYGNSFIFVEEGIEFSVFPDGQFDFFMTNYGPNVSVSINTPHTSISFNSGYDYDAYVQYDEFGAIIQIEHIPVYYDYYGRVRQLGNVYINYNRFGFVTQVGGLFVHYNQYNRFSHCTGFINIFNRFYVVRPWHAYYRVPHFNHCVVFNRPYRQFYSPVRHHFTRPFVNNHRRTTAVANRRGNTVSRRSDLATRSENGFCSNTSGPRRGEVVNTPRTTNQNSTPRPRVSSKPRTETKPRVQTNTTRPIVSTKPRVKSKSSIQERTSRPSMQVMRASKSKNKVNQNRKSSISKNSNRIASNTRKRR